MQHLGIWYIKVKKVLAIVLIKCTSARFY